MTLTEMQSKSLFLSLLLEFIYEGLGVQLATDEEIEVLLSKIDEANEGQEGTETLERTIGTIDTLLIDLGIRSQAQGEIH